MNAQKIGLGVPALQLLPVTGGWTSALAFYHIALSGRVVYHRLSKSKYGCLPFFAIPKD